MRLTATQRRYRRLKRAGLCVYCEDKRGRRAGKAYCRPCLDYRFPRPQTPPIVHQHRTLMVRVIAPAPGPPRVAGTLAARRRAIGLCPCGDTDPIDGTCARCKVAA